MRRLELRSLRSLLPIVRLFMSRRGRDRLPLARYHCHNVVSKGRIGSTREIVVDVGQCGMGHLNAFPGVMGLCRPEEGNTLSLLCVLGGSASPFQIKPVVDLLAASTVVSRCFGPVGVPPGWARAGHIQAQRNHPLATSCRTGSRLLAALL